MHLNYQSLNVGGRIILLTSSALSSAGYKIEKNQKFGHHPFIKERERLSVYGTDEELLLYSKLDIAVSNLLKVSGTDNQGKIEEERVRERNIMIEMINLAEKCLLNRICVDVFILHEDRLLSDRYKKKEDNLVFKDIAILSECSDRTGGNTHYVTGSFKKNENCMRLNEELSHTIGQAYSADVILKLRTNNGLKLHNYYGVGNYQPLVGEVEYSGIGSDTTFCFTLRHDSNTVLKDDDKCHLQLAILYTDINMRRLVRVLNLTLTASVSPAVIFRHTDLDCVITTITKIAVEKALNYPLSFKNNIPITGMTTITDNMPCRDWLVSTAADILKQYRKHCSPQSPRGQLILPEPLKLLPLYTLGLLKHTAFVENFPIPKKSTMGPLTFGNVQRLCVRASERAFELRRLRSLPVRSTICTIYPRFYSFRHCENFVNENDNSFHSDSGSGPSSQNGTAGGNGIIKKSNSTDTGLYLCSNLINSNGSESPVPSTLYNLPTLIPIENLGPESLTANLPPPLAVTSEAIESDGLYLLDDGVIMWFIIGKSIPIDWLQQLFVGVDVPLIGHNRPQSVSFLSGDKSPFLGEIAENIERVINISRQISSNKQGKTII